MPKDNQFHPWTCLHRGTASGRWLMCFCLMLTLLLARPGFSQDEANLSTNAQSKSTLTISGRVTEADGTPIEGCQVIIKGQNAKTNTDSTGRYSITANSAKSVSISFQHVGYLAFTQAIKPVAGKTVYSLSPMLSFKPTETSEVEITASDKFRDQVSITELKPKDIKTLPSTFGDFNMILATLPGVISNNELSSQYSVRGGNFDENLVYVNDIEIYRPFLVRAGQQEGLSFVNPDMVKSVEFSSGGWQPRFGDKLSSVLNVAYKTPTKFGGSLTAGILNQAVSLEGTALNNRLSWVAGVRRKSSQYLFSQSFLTSGLPVTGEYLPNFVDAQTFINYNFTTKADSAAGRATTLGLLVSYANNNYLVRPKDRETDFGTLTQTLRLYIAFIGQEKLFYETWQAGLKLSHTYNPNWKSDVTFSAVNTTERERTDIEGGYRLCDVQKDPSKSNFNECVGERGIGTYYQYARNDLDAIILNVLNRNYFRLDPRNKFEFGVSLAQEQVNDRLDEYTFVDSSDFVRVSPYIFATNKTITNRVSGYVQHTWLPSSTTTITYGLRYQFSTLNRQHLLSPRVQLSYKPEITRDIIFKLSTGIYHQPPFYREMRNAAGVVNTGLLAQSSAHFIGGADYNLKLWGRPFKITGEAYYKYLWNVVPYDVDNVRLRYFATNSAVAYAAGTDLRFSGEFINGAESWISLGVMQTKELIDGNPSGWTRRPTDQLITASVFFQDHLPNAPSARVYLNAVWGTGLPFGPPGDLANRGMLSGAQYRRVDIGFSKIIVLTRGKGAGHVFDNIWCGLEVLNLLGVDNTISYTWVKDVFNTQFAVPNTLSTRFFNLRVIGTLL